MTNQQRRLALALILFTIVLLVVTFRFGEHKQHSELRPLELLVVEYNQTTAPPSHPSAAPAARFQVEHLAWTTIHDSGETLPRFLSAYYDDRITVKGRPAVVILGYHPKVISDMTLYCQLTYPAQNTRCQQTPAEKIVLRGSTYVRNLRSDPIEYICELDCEAADHDSGCTEQTIPTLVALSPSSNCADSSANIPVHNRRPVDNKSMHEFAVCVESPVYRKSPTQIAEFIEMQRVLGAQHITMYIMDDITEKLKLFFRRKYSDNGLLEVVKWKQLRRRTEMHYYGELLLMHDCLYRNMNRAKYLVFVDMDEVILPIQHDSWSNMIIAIDTKPSIGAFVFLNKYFTNNPESTNPAVKPCMELDVPVYFKWTKQYLCKFPRHRRSKFIAKPRLMKQLDIHSVIPLSGYFELTVPVTVAINAHYRYRKSRDCTNSSTTVDTTILKYQSKVMEALKQKICPVYYK